jgi:chromosome segregation ATPase
MSSLKIVVQLEIWPNSSHLSEEIALQSAQIDKLEAELAAVDKRIKHLTVDRDNLLRRINDLHDRIQKDKYMQQMQANIVELSRLNMTIDELNRQLGSEKVTLKLQAARLLDEVSRLKDEIAVLKQQVP